MKIYRAHNTFIVESSTLIKIAGWLSAGTHGAQKAKAAAFFPFVFVRAREYATPMIINHERIHFRQQLELLFIGFWLLQIVERLYCRLFLQLDAKERYLWRSAEQEAYRNQYDPDYLTNRKLFSIFTYITSKKYIAFLPHNPPAVSISEIANN